MFVLIYVNDLIIVSSSSHGTNELLQQLNMEFAIKDMGQLHYFLGIEVVNDGIEVQLLQRNYIDELLHHANMVDYRLVSTPMSTPDKLSKDGDTPLNDLDATQYISIMGCL